MSYAFTCSRCGHDIFRPNQFGKCNHCLKQEERHFIALERNMLHLYRATPNDKQMPSQNPTHFKCIRTNLNTTTFYKYFTEIMIGIVITQTKYLTTQYEKEQQAWEQAERLQQLMELKA
jgi:hypothetical protein